jgi:hypothetical protein
MTSHVARHYFPTEICRRSRFLHLHQTKQSGEVSIFEASHLLRHGGGKGGFAWDDSMAMPFSQLNMSSNEHAMTTSFSFAM